MKCITYCLPVLLAVVFSSCKKDASLAANSQTGNAQNARPTVAFQLKATHPDATVNRFTSVSDSSNSTGSVNIQWTAANAFVSQIKFEAKKDGSEVEFKAKVNQAVDIFSAADNIGNLSIPGGVYKEVEFKAQLSPNGNNPSLEIQGQFMNGNQPVHVTFRAEEDVEIKGEKANVTINDSTLHKAVTSMDLSSLTRGIKAQDLKAASLTNNDLLISASVNQDLYKTILKNLKDLGDEEDFD